MRHKLVPSARALSAGDDEAVRQEGGRGDHVLPWLETALAECDKRGDRRAT